MQKYEFLYSDDKKFVPIELKKINYGHAPLKGLIPPESEEFDTWKITVTVPNNGGFVVLLLNNDVIDQIKVKPVGVSNLVFENLNRSVDNQYKIYVISEKFEDGFVISSAGGSGLPSRYDVSSENTINDATYWTYNRVSNLGILLTEDNGLTLSADETDINEWYNWQGTYTSPNLIFSDTANLIDDSNEFVGNISETVSLSDMVQLTRGNDVDGGPNGVIRSWYSDGEEVGAVETGVYVVSKNAFSDFSTPSNPPSGYRALWAARAPGNEGPLRLVFGNYVENPDSEYPKFLGWVDDSSDEITLPNLGTTWEWFGNGDPDNRKYEYEISETQPEPRYNPDGSVAGQWILCDWQAWSVNTTPSDEIDPGTGVVQQTGQLAIMQNIRFLKKLLNSTNENLWNSVTTTISILNQKLDQAVSVISKFDDTNSIISNINPRVTYEMVDVEIMEYTTAGLGNWELTNSYQTDRTHGVVSVDLNSYGEPTKLLVSVKPKEFQIEIGDVPDSDLLLVPQAYTANTSIMGGEYNTPNFFYGWNIEFFGTGGLSLGQAKKIVGSYHTSEGHTFKISPMPEGGIRYNSNDLVARIWSDVFEPTVVEVDILEHNAETLSYSLYGKRSMNRTSGLMRIYDHNGNVYKEFSMGTLSNNITGGDIVDYRCNIEDDICFDDEDI